MKKIVEVKRGEPVPSGARWLKDMHKIISTRHEDNHPQLPPEEIHTWATFDVFEVAVQEDKGEQREA